VTGAGSSGPTPLLEVTDLRHTFHQRGATIHAVQGVSFHVHAGEAVALVGESGSGKSTVARCLVRLLEPTAGTIAFDGRDVTRLDDRAFRPLRRDIQMVFQDPTLSLNPRLTVRQTLSEPLLLHRVAARNTLDTQLHALLAAVQLDRRYLDRRPRELSGGQKQRVGIARAIASRPRFIALDEPTSSLDMSIRVQILTLLRRLQRELGAAYLFISHDLSTVRYLCSRVIVMYRGRIVEEGPVEALFTNPQHPYTRALLAAVPIPDPALRHARRSVEPLDGAAAADLTARCRTVRSNGGESTTMLTVGRNHRIACLPDGD
jgi:peptide/nickel transport system ATP-binding protein